VIAPAPMEGGRKTTKAAGPRKRWPGPRNNRLRIISLSTMTLNVRPAHLSADLVVVFEFVISNFVFVSCFDIRI
jgi:hypothetical protein